LKKGRDPAGSASARAASQEELADYVARGTKGLERTRLTLLGIRRSLAPRNGEDPAGDDIQDPPGLARLLAQLSDKPREELVALEQEAEVVLRRYEQELEVARAALAAHGGQAHSA
jgi:hypothetical protein